MQISGPKPLPRAGPVHSGGCLALRSNAAAGRRGQSTSIPASPRPANGTSRRDTRSSPRPAARSPMPKAMTCNTGEAAKALSCRNSSPGAILTRRDDSLFVMAGPAVPGMTRFGLLRQILLQLQPAQLRLLQEARRNGGEFIAVILTAEQIKPLSRDQPKPGVAGKGDAARQIDRVVAPELGAVNIGVGDKRRAIALIAEAPDGAGVGGLELRQTDQGTGVDEVSNRVETLDCDTRVAGHHHPLPPPRAGRGMRGGLGARAWQHKDK